MLYSIPYSQNYPTVFAISSFFNSCKYLSIFQLFNFSYSKTFPVSAKMISARCILLCTIVTLLGAAAAKTGLKVYPRDQTVKLGAKLSLECALDSKEVTQADWYHNGNKS